MPTTTTNIGLTKPTVGADTDAWGTYLNSSLDVIDGIFKADGTGTSVGLQVGSGKVLSVTGTCTINSTSSTIDGAVIGGTTPAAGTFTTMTAATVAITAGAISGNVTAPTQTAGDSSTKLATTAFVTSALSTISGLGSMTILSTPGTSSTTVPTGATKMRATIVGGGASGEGRLTSADDTVIAGGSGATAVWDVAVTAGQTVNYTVAAGVTATTGSPYAGANGNSSSVTYGSQTVTCGGGKASATSGEGGAVSTAGTPTNYLEIPGQTGGSMGYSGSPTAKLYGFVPGGCTPYGFSLQPRLEVSTSNSPAPTTLSNGGGYGTGGAAHYRFDDATKLSPGNGKQGLIILQFFS